MQEAEEEDAVGAEEQVDAVVVSRATSMRRRCGCCCLVAVLSLLPLLVGLLYASSCYKEVFDADAYMLEYLILGSSDVFRKGWEQHSEAKGIVDLENHLKTELPSDEQIINDIDAGSSAGFLRDTDEAGMLSADVAESRAAETVDKQMAAGSFLIAPCTVVCGGVLTEADVLKLIQAELGIYDADKTGKADYALESAGGSVIIARSSRTYRLRMAQTSVFGIPLWYTYNSPRVVIQSGMQPGECRPFTGTQGYVVVQLFRKIFVTEASIEHIPKALAPNGMIDSAPKDCEIWGLENEMDLVGTFLGAFTYSSDGRPLQTFKVENSMAASFRFVELKINSNHGNDHYTCLYRFRVHGYVDPTYTGSA